MNIKPAKGTQTMIIHVDKEIQTEQVLDEQAALTSSQSKPDIEKQEASDSEEFV